MDDVTFSTAENCSHGVTPMIAQTCPALAGFRELEYIENA